MSSPFFSPVAVAGAGSWGTALACLLAQNPREVLLWSHDPDQIAQIRNSRQNAHYLPGLTIPDNITPTPNVNDLAAAKIILLVVPTSAMRSVAQALVPVVSNPDTILLSCAKGIERGSSLRMSQILSEYFPHNPIAVLSGPNHAEEVSKNLPAAAVIGCSSEPVAKLLQAQISTPRFRLYTSPDTAGMELGGAIKNVFAIAAGIAEGLGLGDNATAALVTRALAELRRLGVALGGQEETFLGLSGIGDLMVTCYSTHSRNNRVGRALAQGQTLDAILAKLGMVAEGVPNTLALYEAARQHAVRTPIIDAIHSILYRGVSPAQAIQDLLSRDPRAEADSETSPMHQ